MADFDRRMAKREAIKLAKRKAKQHPGKSYVVYFQERDETCKEFFDICTFVHYQQEYSDVREESVIMIITYHADLKRFCYD